MNENKNETKISKIIESDKKDLENLCKRVVKALSNVIK